MGVDNGEIPDYWNDWRLDTDEFNRIIHNNSNALSAIFGYVAEERVREMYLDEPLIENIRTPKDQDSADKGDWAFDYKGEPMKIEVKSLQTRSIEKAESHQTTLDDKGDEPTKWRAGFHIKGSSDQRTIEYEGKEYRTTLLDIEETDIDIMAVNLYRIEDKWRFAFIKVADLPRSAGSNYPEGLRDKLARSQPKIELPLQDPFTDDLFQLLDDIYEEQRHD